MSNDGLREMLDRLEATRRLIDAARLRVQGEYDQRQAHVEEGAVTPGPALAYRTGRSGRATRRELVTARKLRQMPHLGDAVRAGEITTEHAEVLCAALTSKTEAAMDRDEAMLVAQARHLDVDRFAKVVARWKAHADPDGTVDPDDRLRSQWQMSQSFAGDWFGSCRFDNERGAMIASAVNDRVADLLRSSDTDDRRPIAAVRAEAVAELIRRGAGLSAESAPVGRPKPEIAVTIPLDELTAGVGVGETDGAARGLTAGAIRRLACDADIIPVVLGSDSVVLDVGARTASAPQRLALRINDGDACANPLCDRPLSWCEAHHITHWADGGRSDLDNLTHVCSRCHHLLHEGGHSLKRTGAGHLEWRNQHGHHVIDKPRVPKPPAHAALPVT